MQETSRQKVFKNVCAPADGARKYPRQSWHLQETPRLSVTVPRPSVHLQDTP
ncbi:hypothetical protein DPMN_118125 [Dreissena polymorpha]|uniref:Uncharacterized protein n=1 Tax=Dreissena polymorpha TaxID=45954 RepID=A0A9D4JQT9_DREPO|nr:hypothetical protein DPMN_118125 [Dreissena polymorpha]